MDGNKNTFLLKILKSLLYTLLMVIVSMQGIFWLVSLAFTNMSVEQGNTWIIICMCIGIIFTIFFCTFTILDEIKKKG
ncbi:hypothetical protein KPL47_23060 [Clostridium estertheticum]|uniref:hypothetical protein n=1 Tax=Clostridium estertheticum TaxID=238834 RepID=UPI001C0BE278|nr:hypothetical protein [Clostridium estertheticum]MBU3179176.1 hypothetical protein [Clostridium estertheticum]